MTSLLVALLAAAPLQLEAINAGPNGFLVTSTLITGEKEAVLVDAQMTLFDAHRLAAKVLESGKTLTTIFISHAHPDHYFGLEVLKATFPNAKLLAAPKVVDEAKATGAAKLAYWKPMIGANLASAVVIPSVFNEKSFELDGQKIELITIDQGESDAATCGSPTRRRRPAVTPGSRTSRRSSRRSSLAATGLLKRRAPSRPSTTK